LSISWRRLATIIGVLLVTLYAAATAARLYSRQYYVFLPDYLRWAWTMSPPAATTPTHIFFLFTDHFEPLHREDRVPHWATRYRALAEKHRDSDGRPPQHTWFYPAEQMDASVLRVLRGLTHDGLGEVELHFHHESDTEDSLRGKLRMGIELFQEYGFLQTVDGRTHFAFVHGNSGLDNSNGPIMCGVNTELRLLRELGCFADFTFPSIYLDSQPPFVNNIYAAKDDDQPKSYARRLPLSAITDGSADLMIFQGPLVFAPTWNPLHLFLDLDDGNIHPSVPGSPIRVDRWVRAGIHVDRRPDWVFVKIFAHGASSDEDEDVVVGPTFDMTLSYLERRYNDQRNYVLHYVTAREAYNLVRAAMEGASGDPVQYFDRPIPAYRAGATTSAAPRATSPE
jgi:hypothetical protein